MYLFEFKKENIINNTLITYPSSSFFVYNNIVYYNNDQNITGTSGEPLKNVATSGSVSLYEYNINRGPGQLVYPFITKDGTLASFKTVSTSNFFNINQFQYGDTITSSYPLSASISRFYYSAGQTRNYISALENTFNYYTNISNHYAYSSSLGDKSQQKINFIDIPTIFFNKKIKNKTVKLTTYIDGVKYATLEDATGKGELVQTYPSGTGYNEVAGVVLYNEGAVVLTGAWDVGGLSAIEDYDLNTGADPFKWIYFGAGIPGNFPYSDGTIVSSSFEISFAGVSDTNILTMLCKAPKGNLNYSNNPTYIDKTTRTDSFYLTSSTGFKENKSRKEINIVSSSYSAEQPNQKTTFISKIGIYDKDKNLIGFAKISKPVKKTSNRNLTFKLKYDI